MKKFIIICFIIITLIFIKIPEYNELNNLIIVDSIKVECRYEDNFKYKIYIKEIIPQKKDNGIDYTYKKYTEKGDNLKTIKIDLENKSHKKYFYKDTKYLITNCIKTDKIIKIFNIKPKTITHINNKELDKSF